MRLPHRAPWAPLNHTTVRRETSMNRCSYAPIKLYLQEQTGQGVLRPHHGLRSLTATFKEQNCTPPQGEGNLSSTAQLLGS